MAKNAISNKACAVVTGAGSGIGRAFALEIARRGGRVVCADVNLAAAVQTVELIFEQINKHMISSTIPTGDRALAVRCDVGVYEDVLALAGEAQAFFAAGTYASGVNLVVNNAGIGAGGRPVGQVGLPDWKRTLDVNLWGVVHGCEIFMPLLRQRAEQLKALGFKGPRCGVINVASTASFSAAPLMGPYNVTKAGVLALSETLAAEVSGSGIHVAALCPTFVKTNITKGECIAPASSAFADKLMKWTGVSPESVAVETLNGMDSGRLYILPQLDARTIWRLKRYVPAAYTVGAGLLNRVATRFLKNKEA
jgi:NAD(P)-dependent dehydrogenase (short-subunit alcohol dehydrogenase family)